MSLLGSILIFLTKKTVVSEDILPDAYESPSKGTKSSRAAFSSSFSGGPLPLP